MHMLHMQGNFEKLTREELVIIEGENVLQPAAIQKVRVMTIYTHQKPSACLSETKYLQTISNSK